MTFKKLFRDTNGEFFLFIRKNAICIGKLAKIVGNRSVQPLNRAFFYNPMVEKGLRTVNFFTFIRGKTAKDAHIVDFTVKRFGIDAYIYG